MIQINAAPEFGFAPAWKLAHYDRARTRQN
jgi:hypothetical protein